MDKTCQCGRDMVITLEEVKYGENITIKNVPIFHCTICDRNEVVTGIKEEMKMLLKELDYDKDRRIIFFNETSELAHLLEKLDRDNQPYEAVQQAIQDRINELLDMYILANSLKDEGWKQDLNKRLSEIIHTA